MAAEFVHLHNHTEYSLLDGLTKLTKKGKPLELFNIIGKQYQMPALAITDHGNMYGAMEFYWACLDSGIKPIIGCEVYIAKKSRFDKDKENGGYHHLILLAKDNEGYRNLCYLVSAGFTEGFYYKPRIDKEILQKYSKGLICSSACLAGEIATLLSAGNKEKAKEVAGWYQDVFGKGNYYLEIMDNGLEQQKAIIAPLLELSKETGIPLVATNDCHYLKQEDAYYHDILLCINTQKSVNDPNRMRMGSDLFYYRSPEDMIKTFSYVPEAIKNTLVIADMVDVKIRKGNGDLLPNFEVPEGYTSQTYLEHLCREGLKKRYPVIEKKHTDRLEYELSVIKKMGFASYFLIVWDFIKYSKDHGIPVGPGRGSGAGSIVTYTLGITDICPLKYDLLFERFLNPERVSMPDLDIDFADFGREQVIDYVRNKYGQNNCAQIITFGAMEAKMVVKDVGRVLGFTPAETQKIANAIPAGSSIPDAMVGSKELQEIIKKDSRVAELIKISSKLEGTKRHTGVHAAGLIVAPEDVRHFSPLAIGKKNVVTTQYDGRILPDLGLLKVDFLGLQNLTIINEAVKLIKKKEPDFDLEKISLEDKKTFKLLQEAKTFGIFQLESEGMKDLVRRMKPTTIEDITALNALYRPGPIGAGMLDVFVDCKHGRRKVTYDHPLQEPILRNTYGVILYQEQVMQMAMAIGGFTAGQADGLRKAMGKKLIDKMQAAREKFVEGGRAKGIDPSITNKIYDNMVTFAGYGFNKSHSAAYAYVTYRTAYLKAHYTLEYMTACMNNEIGKSADSKIIEYIDDVKQFGIKTLPPDIRYSQSEFSVEGKNIRFGLLAIKNVGEGAAQNIVETREKFGKFESFEDFLSKIDLSAVNKRAIECLCKAGVFDCFGKNKLEVRAKILDNIEETLQQAIKTKKEQNDSQGFLFGSDEISTATVSVMDKKIPPLDETVALEYEKEVLDFYLSGHPLEKYKRDMIAFSMYRLDTVPVPPENTTFETAKIIRVAGMITSLKHLTAKSDKTKTYATFRVEDMYGYLDCIVFHKLYEKISDKLQEKMIVVVKGKVLHDKGKPKLSIEEFYSMEEAKKKFPPFLGSLRIQVSAVALDDAMSDKILKTIEKYPGKSKVYLEIKDYKTEDYTIETEYTVKYSDECIKDLETLLGPGTVTLQYRDI
ncbi:DNA polymerase III subunit alpha [Candidatus Ruminimicrobiellum ovillum]|uniref:DNA polymerase III subunit alpha n=1 Tax=Candidatus Ruminimicrobiellum ovillum TaxID=1947927 RepID=UPI003559F676